MGVILLASTLIQFFILIVLSWIYMTLRSQLK